MTTQVATLNDSNFAEMAKAMGMSADMGKDTKAKSSTLPRLRIWNQATMGELEGKGKMKNKITIKDKIVCTLKKLLHFRHLIYYFVVP